MDKKMLVEKIDGGVDLSEEEFQFLLWCYQVDEQEGAEHRWHREVNSIVKIDDRYFLIHWMRGLTELQENEFWDQPFEVEKHEYEKTIKVVEWIRKNE